MHIFLWYTVFATVWHLDCIFEVFGWLTDGEERTYGGCEGPDAMYVKLISSDGHEFIVKREHALTSGTIKAMLSGPGEDPENIITQCEAFVRLYFRKQKT